MQCNPLRLGVLAVVFACFGDATDQANAYRVLVVAFYMRPAFAHLAPGFHGAVGVNNKVVTDVRQVRVKCT